MLSLHQLRCFLAAYDLGSLTAAAEELGYAQPSVSEQIRSLEKSLGVQLFRRVGRGVVPTTPADTLRPHAEKTLAAAEEARRAMSQVKELETGTIRFGMFGTVRLYAGARLIADVLTRHPGVRVELIGQNSTDVTDQLRRGRLEAALIAVPQVSDGLHVIPVAKDELVYLSTNPEATRAPLTAERLARAQLVMPETSYRNEDSARILLRRMLHETGYNPTTRVEVEDIETAVEVAGMGLADTIVPQGAALQLVPRLAPDLKMVPLDPPIHETLAIVHRLGAVLSPAGRLMAELATARIQKILTPVRPPRAQRAHDTQRR